MKKKEKAPVREKRSSVIVKNLLSVICVAFIIYVFTFYMDGEMGTILASFLIIAPLVSLGFTVYARNRIRITIDCDGYVNKNNTLNAAIKVEKTGLFPLAIVEMTPVASCGFEYERKTYRLSLIGKDSHSFSVPFKANIAGNAEIALKDVFSCGFLGFLKLKIKNNVSLPVSVGIIPELPEIKSSTQLFRSIADKVMTSDEEEENNSAVLFSSNTTPGYEHREYVQGDPLKRVNWKLSTKKDKLMVRLDEAAASVQPLILFDLFRNENSDELNALLQEEKLICSVFGLLSLLVNQGIPCSLAYYGTNGEMTMENVDTPDSVSRILLKAVSLKVVEGRRIKPDMLSEAVCACIIASTDFSGTITQITDKIQDPDNVSLIGSDSSVPNHTDFQMWYLDGDNNFKVG